MREAKSLGIPLRQPGTGRPSERRSSISELTDKDLVDGDDSCLVWSCSKCHRTVVDQTRPPKTPATAPILSKTTSSPFKDMFRMAGLFGRKVKDESRSKVAGKQAATLPRGHAARSSAVCEVCSQGQVMSSPIARRPTQISGSKVKYNRSSSTPRPAGDGRLHLHSATSETSTNRPSRRT